MSLTPQPHAVRCNNPGNLRKGIKWDGLSPFQSDINFCVFTNAAYGFRALAIDLHTAWSKGFGDIEQLITHYAPPSENDTEAYIKAVCDATGMAWSTPLDLNNPAQLANLCRAIAVHESGGWFFLPNDLIQGIRLALESLNIQPPLIS